MIAQSINTIRLPIKEGIVSKTFAIIAALMSLGLSACASSGAKVTEQQLSQIQVGKSTYNDVVAALGKPTTTTFSSTGTRTAIYSYSQVSTRPETFIPVVGAFVGGADVKSNSVILMFNAQGILSQYSGSGSAIGTGSNLEAGITPERTEAQPRQ